MKESEEIEAVFFDMDGVLVDSFEAWYQAFNETFDKFGLENLSRSEFRSKCWGPYLYENMERFGLPVKESSEYCLNRFNKNIDEIRILSGIKELLESVKIRKVLVTNTPTNETQNILDHFGLGDHFEVVVNGDNIENTKPDPEPINEAAKRLEVKASNVLFVGDTESDVNACKKAGCRVIGLGVEGDWKVESIEELEKLFDEILD